MVQLGLVILFVTVPPVKNMLASLVEYRDRLNEIGGALQAYLDGAEHLISSRIFSHYTISTTFILRSMCVFSGELFIKPIVKFI